MEPISSAKARSQFSEILARTFYQNRIFAIKKAKRCMGILLSPEEFERLTGKDPERLAKRSKDTSMEIS